MTEAGHVVIAQAMWKAENEAKIIDALSSYLMNLEYVQFVEQSKRLVSALYMTGYVICPRKAQTQDIGEILPELKRYKDHPVVDAVRERLGQLYEASLRLASEELGEANFRRILYQVLNNQREGGAAVEPLDVRTVELMAKMIEGDLNAAGYCIGPRVPSGAMVERLVNETVKGSAIAMVLGEDSSRIATIYRDMLEHERIS